MQRQRIKPAEFAIYLGIMLSNTLTNVDILLSNHYVINALCYLIIMLSRHYEQGVQKTRHIFKAHRYRHS